MTNKENMKSLKREFLAHMSGSPEDGVRLCPLVLKARETSLQCQINIDLAFTSAVEGKIEQSLSLLEVLGEREFYQCALFLLWIEAQRQRNLPAVERSEMKATQVVEAVSKRTLQRNIVIPYFRGSTENEGSRILYLICYHLYFAEGRRQRKGFCHILSGIEGYCG